MEFIKNIFTFILIITLTFNTSFAALDSNAKSTGGYTINGNSNKNIYKNDDNINECKKLTSTDSNNRFVPTKVDGGWNTITNDTTRPNNLSIGSCSYFNGGDGSSTSPYYSDTIAISCQDYNLSATTLNNGSSRGTGACGDGTQGCLSSGWYKIKPSTTEYIVYCDMNNEGGGWTRIYNIENYTISGNQELAMPQYFYDLKSSISYSKYMQIRKQTNYSKGGSDGSFFGFKANKYFTNRNENVFGFANVNLGTHDLIYTVDNVGNYKVIQDGVSASGIFTGDSGYLPRDIDYIISLRTNGHQRSNGSGSRYNTDSGLIREFGLYIK